MHSRKRYKPVVAGKLVVAGNVVVGMTVVEPTVKIDIKCYSSVHSSVESVIYQLRVGTISLDTRRSKAIIVDAEITRKLVHGDLRVCRSFAVGLTTATL